VGGGCLGTFRRKLTISDSQTAKGPVQKACHPTKCHSRFWNRQFSFQTFAPRWNVPMGERAGQASDWYIYAENGLSPAWVPLGDFNVTCLIWSGAVTGRGTSSWKNSWWHTMGPQRAHDVKWWGWKEGIILVRQNQRYLKEPCVSLEVQKMMYY
jgi:hypothetical protein